MASVSSRPCSAAGGAAGSFGGCCVSLGVPRAAAQPGPQRTQGQVQGLCLGFFWTLVRPLLYLLVYAVAIGIFLGAGRSSPTSASTCSPACWRGRCSPTSSAEHRRDRRQRRPGQEGLLPPRVLSSRSSARRWSMWSCRACAHRGLRRHRQWPPLGDLSWCPWPSSYWCCSRPPSV